MMTHSTEKSSERIGLPPRHVLAFTRDAFEETRSKLLTDVSVETACFLLARPVHTPSGAWRLIVHDLIEVDSNEYVSRSACSIQLPPSVLTRVLQKARTSNSSVILAHTHPSNLPVYPSERDKYGESLILPVLFRQVSSVPHARLIFGQNDLHAALFNSDQAEFPLAVSSIGSSLSLFMIDGADRDIRAAPEYDRQVRAFGADGQKLVGASRIAIVGLGGTGSVVAQQIAHLGVRDILLIDPDRLEETNLNRVVGTKRTDIGRSKVDVAMEMIRRTNPLANVV